MRTAIVGMLLLVPCGLSGISLQHWTQTDSETIWRGLYTNCDKGYAVTIPANVVAHGSLPPNPNHGILVSASAPDTVARVTLEDERVVGVYDEYDAMEFGNAQAYLTFELLHTHAGPATIMERRSTKFRGLPTVYVHYRTKNGQASIETEESIVYRGQPKNSSPIFYVIWLRTPIQYYSQDRQLYSRIREGFHLMPVPRGECSNK